MSTPSSSRSLRWLGRAWHLLGATWHALLNLLFLALLVGVVWWLVKPAHPKLQDKTALVLDLSGSLVEQRSGVNVRERLMGFSGGADTEEVRVRDVVAVLDAAAKDPKISHAVLATEGLSGGSLPALREVTLALERFKAAGKPVYAWAMAYDQRQYLLAVHATEVWLNPMGHVYVDGYGRQRTYYKGLFDKLGITAQVVRAGKYKSAVETYTNTEPSPETTESESLVWKTLWDRTTAAIEAARKQPAGSVAAAIDSLPASLQAEQGDPAQWALKRKWVDALKTQDELRQTLVEKGAADTEKKTFRQISLNEYLPRVPPRKDGKAVGVVVAQGVIVDGRAEPGTVGGVSTSELIRKAREDDEIAAIVLRVDSPGGSATASEQVRRELELTRKAGKPVIVSMAGLAASGGYWISMAADEVLADEATITGSIGVVGLLPSAKGALDKLDLNVAGVSTTWLTGQGDPRRALDPRFVTLMQNTVDGLYGNFTQLVATARKSTPEKIHELAQGRVWSGKDALARGLVDRLGSQGDAVAAAIARAQLPADTRVVYVEPSPSRLQQIVQSFGMSRLIAWVSAENGSTAPVPSAATAALHASLLATGLPLPVVQAVAKDLAWLAQANPQGRPFALAAHCLCAAP